MGFAEDPKYGLERSDCSAKYLNYRIYPKRNIPTYVIVHPIRDRGSIFPCILWILEFF